MAVGGDVTAQSQAGSSFDVAVGTPLCPLDQITTGSRSRVEFRLAGKDTTTGTSDNAVTVIPAPDSDCVTLLNGILALISSVRGRHCVRTPFIDAGIEGTEAVVAVDGPTGDLFVLVRAGEVGVVDRRDPGDRLLLEAGPADNRAAAFATRTQQLTVATPENVPAKFRDLLLRPEGATDWAVYYPPILLGTGVADPSVREAAALLDSGDPAGAERLLAAAPLEGRDEAAALALRAVAAVSLNDPATGEALADEAVALDPGSGPRISRGATRCRPRGKLDAARAAAEAAVEAAPDDAYAWARLAELELTIGDRRAAEAAVARSLEIAETALGAVDRGLRGARRQRFRRRRGRLPTGRSPSTARRRCRASASVSPRSVRAGSPRAGSRSRRPSPSTRAAPACAPGSPAPISRSSGPPRRPRSSSWRRRSTRTTRTPTCSRRSSASRRTIRSAPCAISRRRPAIAGRRSARRAASRRTRRCRSVAAGRVLDVLGFDVLATQKAARAVDLFPTSPEAHRFLFDAFRGRPGFEIVQTSELLRYQLLVAADNDPVQPSLSEPEPGARDDPGRDAADVPRVLAALQPGRLVRRRLRGDREQRHAGATRSRSATSTGNFSISAGQYYFRDDGFRFNDDVEHSVVSVLAKYAPTPEVTFTAEARGRQTNQGDRFLRSFEDPFIVAETRALTPSLFRLGVHVKPTSNLDLLAVGTVSQLRVRTGRLLVDPCLEASDRMVDRHVRICRSKASTSSDWGT